ncbi:MAG: transposase [Candidatus Thiothrix putei]|uniref:Transposase n=1 Tax=Candidatus Thiothrix putei TaxID=3080811 RepID=A0AA95HFK9_9GAMM|nr:MAG: transposase [Candidatus Thiothrix putei]
MNGATIGCSIFFRAGSYHPERLRASWQRWVLSQVAGRLVVLGDHTHVVKDGGRMPGVVSLRETSETQSKPDYFRGQCWGAVGLLVGSLSACFCLPLSLQIHQGFRHLGEEDANDPTLKLGTRVVQMALSFAQVNDRPVWLVLDAFFATASVFRLARSVWSVALQQPLVQVITRAKKNYVAYFPAPPKPPGRRGRQRQYGMKLVLWEAFDHADFFREVTLCISCPQFECRVVSILFPQMPKPLMDLQTQRQAETGGQAPHQQPHGSPTLPPEIVRFALGFRGFPQGNDPRHPPTILNHMGMVAQHH